MDVDGPPATMQRSQSAPLLCQPEPPFDGSLFASEGNEVNIFLQTEQPCSQRLNARGSLANLVQLESGIGWFNERLSSRLIGRPNDGYLELNNLMDSTPSMSHSTLPSLLVPGSSSATSGHELLSMRPSKFEPIKRKYEMDDNEPVSKKSELTTTNNNPAEPMEVAASNVLPTMNATFDTYSMDNSSSGTSSDRSCLHFLEPLQALQDQP